MCNFYLSLQRNQKNTDMVTLKKHFNKSSNSYTLTLRGLSVEHIRMLNDMFFTLNVDPSDVLPLHVCGVSVPY